MMRNPGPGACSVIGLGKLGAPLAAVLARAGLDVIGVDLDPGLVAAMNTGRAPHPEPGLQDALDRAQGRLQATTDLADAVARTAVSFVIVPTPSDEAGCFRNEFVVDALRGIGAAASAKPERHVVAVVSTVMPGSTAAELAPALEASSGLEIGQGIGLCYSPTFIALGSVINDLTQPDLVLIGESDVDSGDALAAVYGLMCTWNPSVHRMTWVNAEIAKIAVNTFVTTKISYANMLSEICERLPGADVEAVTSAVGDDRRIGRAYLHGGAAYGGPCFPRDNAALAHLAEGLGVDASLATATDLINRRQGARVAAVVAERAGPDARVAILGMAYKPDTAITEESAGLAVARELLDAGFEVACYDPAIDAADRNLQMSGLKVASGLEECVHHASVVVVMTPCPEFHALPEALTGVGTRPVVVDCWRIFDDRRDDLDVVHLGAGRPRPESS